MKRYRWGILTLCSVALGVSVWSALGRQHSPRLQGRPVVDWVREADIEGLGHEQTPNQILCAAGPRILPDLARLLYLPEGAWAERLPNRGLLAHIRAHYEDHARIRENATRIIGVIANRDPTSAELPTVVPGLIRALSSVSPQVRYTTAQSLGALGLVASNAIPSLLKHTRDTDSGVRHCSVEALGRIGLRSPETLHAARAALNDPDAGVRSAAATALFRLEGKTDIFAEPFTQTHQ